MQKTHATLARTVRGSPSTTDTKSALLQANTPSLHVLCLRTRFRWSGCGNTQPVPLPRACFRTSPLSLDKRCAFVDAHTGLRRHRRLTTRIAAPSWLHSSLVRGLCSPGHHRCGASGGPLDHRRKRADKGKAQSQRRGSSAARPPIVDTCKK
ncbi:hypothetical protein C3747_56g111 [Trypanosoma cruzi]|uniref:Uncharacterized protein n=1 Tax=Trypanosoma cruzi TaxID=5693 RepID=A0A2V2WTA3_TRYCR|nr:hypothetical protein C3747_56g111 [Trypanosoma cruzi]